MASNLVGKTISGKYRVDAFLDAGGMGSVYRVWDILRNVPLAMKVLHSELAEDPAMFDRFKREARSLQKLAHPNIVPFYGIDEKDDLVYILEQFIDGPSLKSILKAKKGEPLPVLDGLVYLKAICSALGYAHKRQVVHCDIKPANVMVDQSGRIYLGDFGIARHVDSSTTTMAGAGSPAYMAPEQIMSRSLSPATDIYALGILLFEMFTVQRPFKGTEKSTESAGNTLNERIRFAQLNLAPPSPIQLNPGLDPKLAQVILRALEKDPARRFQSCEEFMSAICQVVGIYLDQIPDRLDTRISSGFTPEPQPFRSIEEKTTLPAPKKNSLILQLGGSGVVLAGIGILVIVLIFMFFNRSGTGNQINYPSYNFPTQPSNYIEQPTNQTDPWSISLTQTSNYVPNNPVTATNTYQTYPTVTPYDVQPSDPAIYFPLSNCAASRIHKGDSVYVDFGGG